MGLYLVFGLVIGFFFGTIAGGLPRNDGDITYQNKTEILRCNCKNCKYMVVISERDEGYGKRKIVPFVSCIKFPTWHDAPMACSFFKSTTNLNGN